MKDEEVKSLGSDSDERLRSASSASSSSESKGKGKSGKKTIHFKPGTVMNERQEPLTKKFNSLPKRLSRGKIILEDAEVQPFADDTLFDVKEIRPKPMSKAHSTFELTDFDGEDERFLIKIECSEASEGGVMKEVKIFEVSESTPVEDLTRRACKRFLKWDDWRFGLFNPQTKVWMFGGTISDYNLQVMSVVVLKVKNAEYFEASAETEGLKSRRLNPFGLFSKTALETKKLKKGSTYLSFILFQKNGEILQTTSHLLPSIIIAKSDELGEPLHVNSSNFLWIVKQAVEFDLILGNENRSSETLFEGDEHEELPPSILTGFPKLYMEAIKRAKKELSLKSLGHLFEEPIFLPDLDVSLVLFIAYISQPDLYLEKVSRAKNHLKWSVPEKLDYSIYDPELYIWRKFAWIHEGTRNRLDRGAYLGLFVSESTPRGVNILVPSEYRQMCPVMKMRPEPDITPEEWHFLTNTCKTQVDNEPLEETLKRAAAEPEFPDTLRDFVKILLAAAQRLTKLTGIELSLSQIFPKSPISVDESSSIVMIVFVIVIGMENELPKFNQNLCRFYPLPLFETVHQHSYKSKPAHEYHRRTSRNLNVSGKSSMRGTISGSSIDSYVQQQFKEGEEPVKRERARSQPSSWVLALLDWHRQNAWKSFSQKGLPH